MGVILPEDPRPQNWWRRLPETTKAVAASIGGVTLVVASLTTLTDAGQRAFQKIKEIVAPVAHVTPAAPIALATETDFCGRLDGRTIYATMGKYFGNIGPEGLKLTKSIEGGFVFDTYIEFDKDTNLAFGINPDGPDKIHDLTRGECHANRISFTRSIRDNSAQSYNGTLSMDSDGKLVVVGGTYEDKYNLKIAWTAWIGHPVR